MIRSTLRWIALLALITIPFFCLVDHWIPLSLAWGHTRIQLNGAMLEVEHVTAADYTTIHTEVWSIWAIAAVSLVIIHLAPPIQHRYRRKRGLCVVCGYDLQGNVSGVCPECGTKL